MKSPITTARFFGKPDCTAALQGEELSAKPMPFQVVREVILTESAYRRPAKTGRPDASDACWSPPAKGWTVSWWAATTVPMPSMRPMCGIRPHWTWRGCPGTTWT